MLLALLFLFIGAQISAFPVGYCQSSRTRTHYLDTSAGMVMDRRAAVATTIGACAAQWLVQTLPVTAAETLPTTNPFDSIRFELYDTHGGVAVMQKRLDDRDFEGLLDFTKEYDQVLRKKYMKNAKKLLPKELSDKATAACNAVTFDLIGINRNSRKGQENYDEANKYLNELKQDAELLLAMESSVVSEE
jgi:hypothetical protein